jgi:hypothetical protein
MRSWKADKQTTGKAWGMTANLGALAQQVAIKPRQLESAPAHRSPDADNSFAC